MVAAPSLVPLFFTVQRWAVFSFIYCYNCFMALTWSGRRQLMYYAVGFLLLLVAMYGLWATFLNTPATCFDNKQDGDELGVDCDGSCSLLCANTAKDPTVVWARAFETAPGAYTAAAYIQNNNPGAGAKQVQYSFQLFDADNGLVKEYDGVTNLPPVQTIPVVVTNLSVGNRVVTHALFAFSQIPTWNKVPQDSLPQLYVSQQNLSADGSRLSAELANSTFTDAKNVTVVAVLFDANGVARAASMSLVPVASAHTNEQVVFTWPNGTPGIVRAEITVLPSF